MYWLFSKTRRDLTSAATSDMINTSKGVNKLPQKEMIEMKNITLVGWNQEQSVIGGLNNAFKGQYTFDQAEGEHSVVVDGEVFEDLRLWDEKEGCSILNTWFHLRFSELA